MSDFIEKFAEELRENKTVIDAAGLGIGLATGSTFGIAFNGAKLGLDVAKEVGEDVKDAAKAIGEDIKEFSEAIIPTAPEVEDSFEEIIEDDEPEMDM